MIDHNATGDLVLTNKQIEQPFEIVELAKTHRTIDVYISKQIGPPHDYVDLIATIRTATADDVIYIHLNTPGGYLDTGIQIINAMRDSNARIICVLDGTVCSMGSLIFLASAECIIHDNCRLMFHNYSGGTYGKGNEQIAQLESTGRWFNEMFIEICTPFLTDDEAADVIAGKDIWLGSEEIRERMEVTIDILTAETKELDDIAAMEAEDAVIAKAEEIKAARKVADAPSKTLSKPKKEDTDSDDDEALAPRRTPTRKSSVKAK